MNNARIILTRGIQGSGKSTWANAQKSRDTVVVSRDDIRHQLFGTYHGEGVDEDLVTRVEKDMALAALTSGKTVVVDAMHLYQKYVNSWQRLGYPVEIKEFPEPLVSLLLNNISRERRVPESVIRSNFRKFAVDEAGTLKKVTISPEMYETAKFPEYIPDRMRPEAFLFDIDGTLAKMAGRSPYDYSAVLTDEVVPSVREVANALNGTYFTVALSGRPDSCRGDTEAWLLTKGIQVDELHMRKEGDGRPDALVKYELFSRDIAPHYDVRGVFDDRPSVCEMWRNIGLTTFQLGDPLVRF